MPRSRWCVVADVTKPDEVRALFDAAHEKFGRLDVLFNNAGVDAPFLPLEDLHLRASGAKSSTPISPARFCARSRRSGSMKDQTPRGGRIINNGSISAHAPRPNSAPYTATEARDHRADQVDVARRPQVRHRLRPDRHRQCADRARQPPARAGADDGREITWRTRCCRWPNYRSRRTCSS